MRVAHGKKDGNHDARCADFRALWCSVGELTNTGIPGWPDIVVGCCGVNYLVEIKNPATRYGQAGLNDNQVAFNDEWRGGKVHTVVSAQDVIELVVMWRRAAIAKGYMDSSKPASSLRNSST